MVLTSEREPQRTLPWESLRLEMAWASEIPKMGGREGGQAKGKHLAEERKMGDRKFHDRPGPGPPGSLGS